MEIDPNTEVPTNRLTEEAIQFCKSVGSKAETVDDIAGIDPIDGIIQDEIKKALQRANEVCFFLRFPDSIFGAPGECILSRVFPLLI